MIAALLFLAATNLTPAEEARAEALDAQLRCVVCKNQSIAESESEIAQVMRELVRERIAAGDTDAEVRAYLTDRYGEYVLLRPTGSPKNLILWTGPVIALAMGAIGAFSLFRGNAKPEA